MKNTNVEKPLDNPKLPELLIPKAYPQLVDLRKATNLQLQNNTIIKPFVNFRHYQVIGVMHLLKMNRMILGDGTGLGKCVSGNTLITTDKGLVPIKSFCPENPIENTFYPASGFVIVGDKKYPIKRFYYSGKNPTKAIITNKGYSLLGSFIHPIRVKNLQGDLIFKQLSDIERGDVVCLSKGNSFFPKVDPIDNNQPRYDLDFLEGRTPSFTNYPDHIIPEIIFQGTYKTILDYLKYVISKIGFNENALKIPSTSFSLDLQRLLLYIGVVSQQSFYIENKELYSLLILDSENWNLLTRLLDGSKENTQGFYYDTVEDIASVKTGLCDLMDLEIDDPSHIFIGNGFINHNTVELIGAYSYLLEKDPKLKLLIIAPKSATPQWLDEFSKFTDNVVCQRLENFGKESRLKQYEEFWTDPSKNVMIMHYHFFREDYRLYEPYLNQPFMLVMDEITAVKSHLSKTHKVACLVSEKATRCYGLTATLLKNNLMEGFGIYKVIYPILFGGVTKFKKHFCVEKKQDIGGRKIPIVVGYKNVEYFRQMIDPYFLGRNKYDVSKELPDLITKEIECSLSEQQWDYYTQALGDTLTLPSQEGLVDKEMTPLTRLGYFQQIIDHPEMLGLPGESEKEKELYRLLDDELDGEKVIIFSKYKKMINIIERELSAQGKISVRITGDEDEDQRTLNKLLFQEDQEALLRWLQTHVGPEADIKIRSRVLKSCKTQLRMLKEKTFPNVILLTPAGTEALNLQAAGAFIFYDIPWAPGDYDQLLGRMIRIGSEHKTVMALHLTCKGTVDDYVLQTVLRKSKIIRKVLGEQTKGALSFEKESDIGDLIAKLRLDAENLRLKGKSAFIKDTLKGV